MYLCICAQLIILCIRSIGRGIGGASPSPVIFWIGWKTNGVCCCLLSLHWDGGGLLEKWQSVGRWLHRLMLITGLVASREIWRHGIRKTIRKQSQPSRPIVNPQQSHTSSPKRQKASENKKVRNLDQKSFSCQESDTNHHFPNGLKKRNSCSGSNLVVGLNKVVETWVETTMMRQGLRADHLSCSPAPYRLAAAQTSCIRTRSVRSKEPSLPGGLETSCQGRPFNGSPLYSHEKQILI